MKNFQTNYQLTDLINHSGNLTSCNEIKFILNIIQQGENKMVYGRKANRFGLREPNKNPVYFKSKKERDKAVKKIKKGAWIIDERV